MLLHSRAIVVARASVVHPSSVNIIFPDTTEGINAKFGGQVPINHISRTFFFFFLGGGEFGKFNMVASGEL